jgi:predicted transcriptional regulator
MKSIDKVTTVKLDEDTQKKLVRLEKHYRQQFNIGHPRSAIIRTAIDNYHKMMFGNGKVQK